MNRREFLKKLSLSPLAIPVLSQPSNPTEKLVSQGDYRCMICGITKMYTPRQICFDCQIPIPKTIEVNGHFWEYVSSNPGTITPTQYDYQCAYCNNYSTWINGGTAMIPLYREGNYREDKQCNP